VPEKFKLISWAIFNAVFILAVFIFHPLQMKLSLYNKISQNLECVPKASSLANLKKAYDRVL